MMSDFEKQLNKAVAKTRLSADERRELKARVVSYMEYHPRREAVAQQQAEQYLESQPYTVFNFNNVFLRSMVGVFAIFMVVFVPSLAERAVPGDVLYPIKVRVNEEIRGTLTFSAADKVAWETERLERRIAEVRLLAVEGKLTAEVEAAAAEAVKAHAEAAQDGINKLRDTDAEEAVLAEVAYESALDVQTAVLDADNNEAEARGTDVVAIASVVREAKATAAASKGDAKPSAEKVMARIEQQTTRAYELFSSLEGKISLEDQAEIERRLQDIERAIAMHTGEIVESDATVTTIPVATLEQEGEVAEEAAEDTDVTTEEVAISVEEVVEDVMEPLPDVQPVLTEDRSAALLMVLADIQKLISFMTDIDVRTNVKLEKLVPVVLTPDEREAAVAANIERARLVIDGVTRVVAETDGLDDGQIEKFEGTVSDIEEVLEAVANPIATLEEREAKLAQIEPYVDDIEVVIAPYLVELEEVVKEVIEPEPEDGMGTTTEEVIEPEDGTATGTPETPADANLDTARQ